jgi:hypothetical protein
MESWKGEIEVAWKAKIKNNNNKLGHLYCGKKELRE